MLVLALPASGRFASEGSGVSFLVCFRAKYTVRYAVWRLGLNQGATPSRSRNSRKRIYLQPGAIRSCLSYGKQCASLRRPNKGAERNYARLPRGAKLAGSTRHTRFVCAIPGIVARCPTFAQENPRMVQIRTLRLTTNSVMHCILNCRLQQSKTLTSHK